MAPHVAGTIPDIIGEDMTHAAHIHGQPATLVEVIAHIRSNSRAYDGDRGLFWLGDWEINTDPGYPGEFSWLEVEATIAEVVEAMGDDADWGGWSVYVEEVD